MSKHKHHLTLNPRGIIRDGEVIIQLKESDYELSFEDFSERYCRPAFAALLREHDKFLEEANTPPPPDPNAQPEGQNAEQ